MKIVIKLAEEDYNGITLTGENTINLGVLLALRKAVRNGTPLPEHHGDLIDKGKFKRWIETQDGDKLMTEYYLDALDMQETVVGGSYDEDID